MESVNSDNDRKFILDLKYLLNEEKDGLKMEVLRNMASKLRRGRNHHYSNIILKIGILMRNLIVRASDNVLSVSTTYANFFRQLNIQIL